MAEITTKKIEAEEIAETTTEETKVRFRDAFAQSRPARFVKKHTKGVVAGVAGAGAAVAAAVIAAKAAREGYVDLTDVTETVTDAIPTPDES